MDKKSIAIMILSIAFLVTLIGLISTSISIKRIESEKNKFILKIKDTDRLASELNKNVNDLKKMLGRVEEEKTRAQREKASFARQAEEMRLKLERMAEEGELSTSSQ